MQWYNGAMTPLTRRLMLTARPSSIFRLQNRTPDWLQDIEHIMLYPSDMGVLLNNLYASAPANDWHFSFPTADTTTP